MSYKQDSYTARYITHYLQRKLLFLMTGDCVDIDECEQGYCGGSEKCINTEGSFDCLCEEGMTKVIMT